MKIEFVRSGGFAGLRLGVTVDTETVDSAQASRLETLVHQAAFFDLPGQDGISSPMPDRFEYRVRITSAMRGTHAIVVYETAVPERLRPLLDHLTTLALRQAKPPDPSVDSEE